MINKYILLLVAFLITSCNASDNEYKLIIVSKNKTIDSLKLKLDDCKLQAQSMADVLEKERIEQQNKKDIPTIK